MSILGKARVASVGFATSLLTGTLVMGWGTSLPTRALADNGSITISQRNNADATYDVYRIARGTTIAERTVTKASNLTWESDAIRSVVIPFLDATDNGAGGASSAYSTWLVSQGLCAQDDVTGNTTTYQSQRNLAQNAMQYISEKIGASVDAGTNQAPDAKANGSFATRLANAIAESAIDPIGTVASGTAYSGTEGYYLFMGTPSTVTGNDIPTHPIWVPIVDDMNVTMQEKSFAPTVSQQVKVNREGNDWHSIVDANNGDDVTYKTTVALPANFGAYSSYPITIMNTMESGITPSLTGMQVLIDGVDVTNQCTIGIDSDGKPYVTVDNLNTLSLGEGHAPVTKDSTIEFLVPATVNANATIGIDSKTNDNIPSIVCPKDDGTGVVTINGTGTSVATYRTDLMKVDKETRRILAGAKFYVKSGASYVKTDGTLVTYTDAVTEDALSATGLLFTSDVNGFVTIPHLDEGTYEVHELTPPAGYESVSTALIMAISATKNQQDIQVSGIAFSASGWTGLATPDSTSKIVSENQDGICSYSVDDGTFAVRISNTKEITLPVTGLRPRQLTTIIGASILILSMLLWARSRHAYEKGEDISDGDER